MYSKRAYMIKCDCCNFTVDLDPSEPGRGLPPGFQRSKINGRVYTLCTRCLGDMLPGTDYHVDDPEVPAPLKKMIRCKKC